MVLIGLLVVAVAALVLGLVLKSTVWLIVSLAASLLAAATLVYLVRAQRRRAAAQAEPAHAESADAQPTDVKAEPAGAESVGARAADAKPLEAEAIETGSGADRWQREPALVGAAPSAAEFESGATASADIGDSNSGAAAARSADAGGAGNVADSAPGSDAQTSHEVWVADGYPEYHVHDCSELQGLEAEQIPYDQAVEDGFQPCVVCDPDAVAAGRAPAGLVPDDERAARGSDSSRAGTADDVWVVDGQPEYHREGCERVAADDAERIPRSQAVEDGFTPCTACTPDREGAESGAARAAADSTADTAADDGTDSTDADSTDTDSTAAQLPAQVWVVDGQPDYHREGCERAPASDAEQIPRAQAVEDGFTPCAVCAPDRAPAEQTSGRPDASQPVADDTVADVWVVDGFPDYHRPECPQILGLNSEPVPHSQAVEDGFAACTTCRPDDVQAPEMPQTAVAASVSDAAPGSSAQGVPDQVWVVDGQPEFHVAGCERLDEASAEQIPGAQAVEDGFTACTICEPLGATATAAADVEASAQASATSASVWVVDAFPEYHRENCRELAGLDDEPVPHDQAVEDGFTACEICRPEDDTAPDGFDRPADTSDAEAAAERDAAAQAEGERAAQAEREAAEQAEREAAAQAEREAAAQAEREAAAQAEREAAEQAEREAAAQAEREAAAQTEREAAAQAERDAAEQAEREAAEQAEREAAEQAEREAAEQAEREVAAQAEREAAAQAEREAAEQAEREAAAQAERDAAEQAEREAAAQAEREAAEQAERAAAEQAEREAAAQAERAAAEQAEREAAEREAAEQAKREQDAREAAARAEREAAEQAEREAAEQRDAQARQPSVPVTGAASGSVRRVWVIDGRPRYHAQDCLIIKGQHAVPMMFDEAVESGFAPCSLCSRD